MQNIYTAYLIKYDKMCLKRIKKRIKKYFEELDKREKIQSRGMEKAIERSSYISEAYLQGGKAAGEIIKPKKDKKK